MRNQRAGSGDAVTEKDFTRDLIRGLKSQGAYAEKWPDLARAVTKPYDIAASYALQFMPIECKLRDFRGQEMLPGKTVILSPADFKGRKHQLPRLLKLYANVQAYPYIAAFMILYREFKQPIKKGWLIPVRFLQQQETWTLLELVEHNDDWGLVWVPSIGWTCPWLPEPDPKRLQEDSDVDSGSD
jgi:hypothetical protein